MNNTKAQCRSLRERATARGACATSLDRQLFVHAQLGLVSGPTQASLKRKAGTQRQAETALLTTKTPPAREPHGNSGLAWFFCFCHPLFGGCLAESEAPLSLPVRPNWPRARTLHRGFRPFNSNHSSPCSTRILSSGRLARRRAHWSVDGRYACWFVSDCNEAMLSGST